MLNKCIGPSMQYFFFLIENPAFERIKNKIVMLTESSHILQKRICILVLLLLLLLL